jgi:hypothetical protein
VLRVSLVEGLRPAQDQGKERQREEQSREGDSQSVRMGATWRTVVDYVEAIFFIPQEAGHSP